MMNTPISAGKQMSDSLKARLKRCGRSYTSPVPVKRQCITPVSSVSSPVTYNNTDKSDCFSEEESNRKPKPLTPFQSAATPVTPKAGSVTPGLESQPDNKSNELNGHYQVQISHDQSSDDDINVTGPCRRLAEVFQTPNKDCSSGNSANEQDKNEASNVCNSDHCKQTKIQSHPKSDSHGKHKGVYSSPAINIKEPDRRGENVQQRLCHLKKLVADQEEKLRKLKMVKMYRMKNNLDDLTPLISKWKSISQEALIRLHGLAQDPKPTLTQLVNYLQLDYNQIGFCPDDENFTD